MKNKSRSLSQTTKEVRERDIDRANKEQSLKDEAHVVSNEHKD